MKILLTSIGTRGDIEPFLAIGELLLDKGHEIIFLFPQQFEKIVDKDYTFHPLSPRMIELIESKEGRIVMGKAKVIAKFRAIIHLYKEGLKINKELIQQQHKIIENTKPDLIIHNAKCNYPFIWGLKHNKKTILVSPVPYFIYYVKGYSHIGFKKNFGPFLNKLTYKLSSFGLIKTIYDSQKHLQKKTLFSKKAIKKALFEKKLVYTISPTLFSRPDYWKHDNVQILGYHERDKVTDWEPTDQLIQFLEKKSNILFITFGSMVNSFPEDISRMIYKVLDKLEISAIVNTAAGGLCKIKEFEVKNDFYFVEQIPYDWILSRIDVMVHHGGSGTTHTALKYGCPTLIIPHIIDQFNWNTLIHEIGAGPKGVSINKLTANKLEELLSDLLNNDSYHKKAKQIAIAMANEQLEDTLHDFIMDN